ncbi:MAG TPA: pectin acetylesterase-family hydrolase [Spirillospora sp.]|nr:pectin acetylesterase-family hydrolase [Spirillospora sp.]
MWEYLLALLGFLVATGTLQSQVTFQCPAGEMRVNGVCGSAAINTLESGWNTIEPGGETGCAHGDPYAFWVHPGKTDNLLIYFEGGGGCWNAQSCRDNGQRDNGYYVSRVEEPYSPARQGGIFDLHDARNPFQDYTYVHIPLCTGDTHWGSNVVDLGDGVVMNFNGFVNAQSALEWTYANVLEPDSIFLGSCSAGSIGSLIHAPYIIEQYPGVPLVQFGDSLSGLTTQPVDMRMIWGSRGGFPDWIPALANMQPLEWTAAKHFIAVANHYPDYTFAQFNTMRDAVQVFFTFPDGSGDADDWTPMLEAHLAEIEANTTNYRSFTTGGDLHCVMRGIEFYTYAINGVRLVDWVADLAAGREVESLHCADCSRPETVN